jgi:hypothetical protein
VRSGLRKLRQKYIASGRDPSVIKDFIIITGKC